MYGTLILFPKSAAGLGLEGFRKNAEKGLQHYQEMPGLRMKTYLFDPETGQFGGFYLWQDEAAFKAMFEDPEWQTWIKGRYGALPQYRSFAVPFLVDNDPPAGA